MIESAHRQSSSMKSVVTGFPADSTGMDFAAIDAAKAASIALPEELPMEIPVQDLDYWVPIMEEPTSSNL